MDTLCITVLYSSVLLALVWSIINSKIISRIKVEGNTNIAFKEMSAEDDSLVGSSKIKMITIIGERISKGANAFLIQEYTIMLIFIGFFSVVVLVVVDIFGQQETGFRFYATSSFIIGSLTSILCGWIGMSIAVKSNYRTTFLAM